MLIAPVPGWPGYFATSDGRIVSFWRRRLVPGYHGGARAEIGDDGRELAAFDRRNRRGEPTGYLSVCLSFEGRRRNRYVHDLVLSAFRGPRPSPTHEACHGNGRRGDNRIENLRWGTPAENTADRRRHGSIDRGVQIWRERRAAKLASLEAADLDELGAHERHGGGCFDDLLEGP